MMAGENAPFNLSLFIWSILVCIVFKERSNRVVNSFLTTLFCLSNNLQKQQQQQQRQLQTTKRKEATIPCLKQWSSRQTTHEGIYFYTLLYKMFMDIPLKSPLWTLMLWKTMNFERWISRNVDQGLTLQQSRPPLETHVRWKQALTILCQHPALSFSLSHIYIYIYLFLSHTHTHPCDLCWGASLTSCR